MLECFFNNKSSKKFNLLDEICEMREDELAEITDEDREYLNEQGIDIGEVKEDLLIAVNNVPDAFLETKALIIKQVDALTDEIYAHSSYFNDKHYRAGLKDGISLIIRGLG